MSNNDALAMQMINATNATLNQQSEKILDQENRIKALEAEVRLLRDTLYRIDSLCDDIEIYADPSDCTSYIKQIIRESRKHSED